MKGLYIHIPFCVKKCSYCDFYSLPARLHARESYVNAVLRESETYAGMSFQTMYLGEVRPAYWVASSSPTSYAASASR